LASSLGAYDTVGGRYSCLLRTCKGQTDRRIKNTTRTCCPAYWPVQCIAEGNSER